MNHTEGVDNTRWNRWVQASRLFQRFDAGGNPTIPFLIPVAQGLGTLDARLVIYEATLVDDVLAHPTMELSMELTDHVNLSWLWVLGACEFVRNVKRLAGELSVEGSIGGRVRQVHDDFRRLRIPLAKMEPARGHQDTDSPIAFPGISPRDGVAWHLSQDVWISRRSLSDALLEILEDWAST